MIAAYARNIYNMQQKEKQKMKKSDIKPLLDRFMNGETTLEEERTLGEYFATSYSDGEWDVYKKMFAYFDNGMKDVEQDSETQKKAVEKPIHRRWWQVAAVALVIVAGGMGWMIHQHQPAPPSVSTVLTTKPMYTTNIQQPNRQQERKTSRPPQSVKKETFRPKAQEEKAIADPPAISGNESDWLTELQLVVAERIRYEREQELLEQETRNNLVETAYALLPDNNERICLVMDESGNYQIVAAPSPIEL